MNQDRPTEGSAPSPFGSMAEESPFGLAESEAGPAPAQLPPPATETPAPRNPFRSKTAKPQDGPSEVPPFEMPKAGGEGGFEMKGISASEAPVGNIDKAPIGNESASAAAFAGSAQEMANEASNPFGGAKEAPVADKPSSAPPEDFGGLPENRSGGGATEAPAFPTAAPAPATPAPAPVVENPAPAPAAAAPAAASAPIPSNPVEPIGSIKQLEVRAIFGVDRELNRNELIQRAKTLPGIKNLSAVSGEEVVAMETVQNCMANLGFGQTENILLTCPNGVIEFISHGTSTMAVVRSGDWKPGVRETLFIISREIDKL